MVTRGALGLFLRRRLPHTDVDLLLDTSAKTTLTTPFKKDQQQQQRRKQHHQPLPQQQHNQNNNDQLAHHQQHHRQTKYIQHKNQRAYNSNDKKRIRTSQNKIGGVANANYTIQLTLPLKPRKRESKAEQNKTYASNDRAYTTLI